jgi:hypothetical protein
VKANKFTVNATATKIVNAEPMTRTVYIHSSTGSIYLGGSTLTSTADGLHLPNGNTLAVTIPANETLYAIDGAGTATAIVLDWDAAE